MQQTAIPIVVKVFTYPFVINNQSGTEMVISLGENCQIQNLCLEALIHYETGKSSGIIPAAPSRDVMY